MRNDIVIDNEKRGSKYGPWGNDNEKRGLLLFTGTQVPSGNVSTFGLRIGGCFYYSPEHKYLRGTLVPLIFGLVGVLPFAGTQIPSGNVSTFDLRIGVWDRNNLFSFGCNSIFEFVPKYNLLVCFYLF